MKQRKAIYVTIIGCLLSVSMLLGGCVSIGETQYEVASYQGELKEGETKTDFNHELFYRNDKKTTGADPFVFDNTERDGYYYLFATTGACFCYRSKDMSDWKTVGHALDLLAYGEDGAYTEERQAAWTDIWAPEMVYDSETELYYLFFSASSREDTNVKEGNGVKPGTAIYQMMVATSKYPDRDFKLVNFMDAESCGKENLHDYDTKKYPHYYAKYFILDPSKYTAFTKTTGSTDEDSGFGGYTCSIDPHPFVDEDGTKYLFWTDNMGENRINAVKMDNWLKPDWSTATAVAYCNYYTVEDRNNALTGAVVSQVSYENGTVNEGPVVVKHNDKYYLTFSVNAYTDSSYQVAQAVADSPLGPYRKLTLEEGGVLLSGGVAGSQKVSGSGHHSFITVGEQRFIVYHKHDSFTVGGNPRHTAFDEVKWITVKDKDGNDLDVMYANGPTWSVQPKIEAFSEYENIADEASISGAENTSYLNDGLLSIYKYGDPTFMEYIKETTIHETTTFTFNFDEPRAVRAVMVYNSKMEFDCFQKISRVELVCEENGEEVVRYIKDIEFSAENLKLNDMGGVFYVDPGAAAYAEFDELNVKTIRITIEVPEGQEQVGISEIRILGK
ncbi:MAG: family 43 glycosylhydrolase [Tyzzerella sp.]|nr:family 43 glycosylhydrolase [Tyzzerella sp.]